MRYRERVLDLRPLVVLALAACTGQERPSTAPASIPAQPVPTVEIRPLASVALGPSEPEKPKPRPNDPAVVLTLDTVAPGEWSGSHANAPVAASGLWGDASSVFAVGNGTILRSTDRGVHWTTTRGPSDYPVVWGASIDDIYVGGATVVRSTDRGTTWVPAEALPGSVYGLWGSGADDVWAVGGSPAFVAHTSNHGATWTEVKLPGKPLEWVYDVSGAASDVWIVGKRRGAKGVESAIFLSTNRGKAFTELAPPKPGMTDNEQSRKVCVTPSGATFLAMSYSLYATRDKGKTWKLATPINNSEVLSLACRDRQIVVGGRNHALFVSKDDGASFRTVSLEAPQAAFIAPGGEVFVALESYDQGKGKGTLLRREP